MGKHAKTYSTQAAYEADMENWEYPHLSLIISGGTVVYNTSEQVSALQFGATDYYCSQNMNTSDITPSEPITLYYNGEEILFEVPGDVTFGGELIDLGVVAVEPDGSNAVFNAYGNATGTVTAEYMGETATTTVHATMIEPEE